MTEYLKEQFLQFGAMLYLGTVIFFLYGQVKRYLVKFKVLPQIAALQEMLFFLFAALLTGWLLEYLCYGQIGWYTILGFLLGYPIAKVVLR